MHLHRKSAVPPAIELHVPEIPEPCDQPWDAMAGTARMRHCAVCDRDVHNLAAMPAAEIAHLLNRPGPLPCIRVSRDEGGALLTTEPAGAASHRRGSFGAAWVTAISAALTVSAAAQTPAPGTGEVVGRVAPPNASVTGRLVDAQGRSVADARVSLLSHGAPRGTLHVAPDGSFELKY